MNPRLTARGQEETPTTCGRRGPVELDTLTVGHASPLVKGPLLPRVSISSCPDLRPRPEVHPEPLLQASDGPEVREHLSGHDSLDGAPTHLSPSLHGPQRGVAVLLQRLLEATHELLAVDRRGRGVLLQPSGRPLPPRDVLARGGVSSRPWHASSVGPGRPGSTCVAATYYSCDGGTYRTHPRGGRACRGHWSSGVTS